MNAITKKIISMTLMAAVTLMSVCGGKAAKAAAAGGKYVKDITISYASSKEDAQKELGDDFVILDQDFNKGKSGSSWIGYTTTDDPEQAIRDIKVELMSGGYSVSEYEEILKNKKDAISRQLDIIIPALTEYAKNYDANLDAAILVNRSLNYYYEDDSDTFLGDFLLDKGRALARNNSDNNARKELEKVFVQGNDAIINAIERIIIQGADTKVGKKGAWHTRMGELGPNGLIDQYKVAYPRLKTTSAINKQLEKDFGADVDVLMKELPDIRKTFSEYADTEMCKAIENGDADKTAEIISDVCDIDTGEDYNIDMSVDEMGDTLSEALDNTTDMLDVAEQTVMGSVMHVLKNTPYGTGQSLYDFFMREDLKRSDLYTFAYVLSSGQKSILEDIGLLSIFQSVISEYSEMDEQTEESIKEMGQGVTSVYEGVDRDVFNGDTALTEDALKRMKTEDDNESLTIKDVPWECVLSILAVSTGIFCLMSGLDGLIKVETLPAKPPVLNSEALLYGMNKELLKIKNFDSVLKLKYIQDKKLIKDFTVNVKYMEGTEAESVLKKLEPKLSENGNLNKVNNLSSKAKAKYIKSKEIQLSNKIDAYNKQYEPVEVKKIRFGRAGARIAYLLGAVVAFGFVGYEIYTAVKEKPGVEYTEIPENMVSRTYEGNEIVYMTYSVAKTAGGKKADLHNWKRDEWLAVYTTSDENAGDPILANTLRSSDTSSLSDAEYNPVTRFCYTDGCELLDGDKHSAYMFFKQGTEAITEETEEDTDTSDAVSGGATNTEASVFGYPSILYLIGLVLIAIILGAGGVIYARRRRTNKK
ncbi:MAG: hypothetical protein VZQ83_01380 [Eubacterium sp.]|nr:hypothetical protein [Eubacterium sp.]